MEKQNTPQTNSLWMIRHGLSLETKQVARLIGQNSSKVITSFERGERLPTLIPLMKLMVVYKSTPQEMFPELFEQCRTEVEANLKRFSSLMPLINREKFYDQIHECTYEELARRARLDYMDVLVIRKHLVKFTNLHAEALTKIK